MQNIKYILSNAPILPASIVALGIGVLAGVLVYGDLIQLLRIINLVGTFLVLSLGGVSIWMLKVERRAERRNLRWVVGMMMIVAFTSLIPQLHTAFSMLHGLFILLSIVFLFQVSAKGYLHNHKNPFLK